MNTRRILAKLLDYTLFFAAIYACGFPMIVNIILLALTPILFAPIEALFLSQFRTTVGKYFFSLQLTQKISLTKALKVSFKKAMLILPLLFAPLNLAFAWFYLRESEEHKTRRWSNFGDAELVYNRRSRRIRSLLVALMFVGMSYSFTPTWIKTEILQISKQELDLNEWVEVKDKKLNFSVYFPSEPKKEEKAVEVEEHNTTLDVTQYTHTESRKIAYKLQSSKIPSSWTLLGSNYLFKALSGPLEKHQGKIVKKQMLKHGGSLPAMSYLLNTTEGGQTSGRMILVKKTIYKLEVTSKSKLSKEEIELANNFINSFDIH